MNAFWHNVQIYNTFSIQNCLKEHEKYKFWNCNVLLHVYPFLKYQVTCSSSSPCSTCYFLFPSTFFISLSFLHIIKIFIFSLFYFFPFPLPLEGLASNEGSMSFGSSPLTENSLSARCCRVPPHFIPLSIRRDFNFSSPKTSISVALL